MKLKRVLLSFVTYGAVVCEALFAWFMYLSIRKLLSQIYDEKKSSVLPSLYISLAVIFSVVNLIEDVLSINPAEETYDALNGDDEPVEESTEESDVKGTVITKLFAYLFFVSAACTDSVPIVQLMQSESLLPARLTVSLVPVVFTIAYYRMFSYDDMLKHHRLIYGKIGDRNQSVAKKIVKSPLRSLEVCLTVGVNVIMRSILYGFVMLQFIPAYLGLSALSSIAQIIIFSIMSFATAYATLFSRLDSTLKRFFPGPEDQEQAAQSYNKEYVLSRVPSMLLRLIRSAGIVYFAVNWVEEIALKASLIAILSLFFAAHSIYASLVQLPMEKEDDLERVPIPKATLYLANTVNLISKIGFSLLLMASCFDLSDRFDLKLTKMQLILLSLTFSIPMNLNNFDYYSEKLIDAMLYYPKKFSLEKDNHQFGYFGSFFHSIKEYENYHMLEALTPNLGVQR